ncbi:MAG: hypothetical protein ACJAT2_001516 [Bacteriovoracaceae bacterium]|jgi:hypothetical protein
MRSKKNIIFADSTPRGLEVRNEKNDILGSTPMFFKVRPKGKRSFSFFKNGEKVGQQEYKCALDWGGSIVPNIIWSPLFPIGTILSGVFLFTDSASKAVYVCKNSLFVETEKKPLEKKSKKKIIALPIAVGRGSLADLIRDHWHENQFKTNHIDEEFLWNESIEHEFIYRGIDLYANTEPLKIKRRFINEIGHKFGATHLLHFSIEETKTEFIVTPKLYDIFTFKSEEASFLNKYLIEKEKQTPANFWRRALRNIDFFPNALTLSYSARPKEKRIVVADPTQNGEFDTSTHPEAFPKFLTLFSVESVHHPQFFSSWDWGAFLSPNFGASSFRTSYSINGTAYNYDFESYHMGYTASLTGFTPIGQLNIGIGLLGSYYSLSDNTGYENSKFGLIVKLNLSYHKFFNERFYFTAGQRFYSPSKETTQKNEYQLESWGEYYMGFGYYFPEVKTIARKLFGL